MQKIEPSSLGLKRSLARQCNQLPPPTRLIFQNVHAMTQVLHRLLRDGVAVREETLRHLSPYLTEHINRFGVYEWNPQRAVAQLRAGDSAA
ncbi:MAG TPA: Tn3 family transposase [Blastocatellia bacterium]|nr:Tn3 family transposase [Blastocatellia bacterium]